MNQKELNEIRRRLHPEKTTVGKIYGCFVNTAKNVIARFERSVGLMSENEREKYMAVLKGALAGTLGKNLIAVPFSARDAGESEKHRLLSDLRRTSLADEELREKLYGEIIGSFEIEDTNLLILLADDVYDVPKRNRSGEDALDDSETVYHYILCAVCPVKDGKPALGYDHAEKAFTLTAADQLAGPPVTGFLFPSFDGRSANIYSALYFTKNAGDVHPELMDALFGTPAPMSSEEQKDAFCEVLAETLDEECSFSVVRAVHEELRGRLSAHKESRDPEICEITAAEVGDILADNGVDGEKVSAFRQKCTEKFGGDLLIPDNLIARNRFKLETAEATINVDPDASVRVETRIIDGRKYILIPADGDLEINGMNVHVD